MLVYGCIQQAIDIIVSCVEYGCVPYIRYPVSLHYISLLSEGMMDIDHINTLRFKMSVAFVVYKLCDKDRLVTICTEDFLKKNREYSFDANLFQALAKKGITEKNFLGHTITALVMDELERFDNFLLESNITCCDETQSTY